MAEPGQTDESILWVRLLGLPCWHRATPEDGQALSRKDAALFAVLALDGPQQRDRLAALLWPDVPGSRASSNLRQRLFRLRQQTGHALLEQGELLRPSPGLRLDLSVLEAQALPEDAQIGGRTVDLAEELLGGLDFAEDGDLLEDWVRQARSRWRDRRIDLLTGQAARQEARGELAAALASVSRLLAIDALQEHVWRRQMRLHHRRGDRAAAVASFERCEQVLKDELGLKPSAETLALLEAIEQARPPVGAPLPPPLPSVLLHPPQRVGREAQWAQMLGAWQAGRPFLLRGEAGMGKSRLLNDLSQAVPDLLCVQALPGDDQVPLATLARVFRRAISREGLDLPAALRAELSRLLPELGPAPDSPASSEAMQQVTDQALQRLSRGGWKGLLIDDAQHLDGASLAALHRHAGEAQALLLGFSTRPQASAPEAGLVERLLTESVRAVPVELGPLPPVAAGQLVAQVQAALPVARDWPLDEVLPLAAGNPFFLLETLKGLWWQVPGEAGAPLAATVGALIEHRLRPVSAQALAVLRVAALAGADAEPELVARVLDRPVLALADEWAELDTRQLLRQDGRCDEPVARTLMAAIPAALRASLHRRIAAALADRPGAAVERRAQHLARAGDWAEAGRVLCSAAELSKRLGQRDLELRQYRQAAAWFQKGASEAAAFDAQVQALQACQAVEGHPAALAALDQLKAMPLVERTVTPAERRRVARLHMAASYLLADMDAFDEALAHGEQGLALTDEAEPLGWELRSVHAMSLALAGRAEAGVALLERVLVHARGTAPRETLLGLLGAQAYALNFAGRRRDAVRVIEESLDLGTLAEGWHEYTALGNLSVQYAVLGRQAEAIAAAQRARVAGQALGANVQIRGTEVNLGLFLLGAGRAAEGLALLQEVLADSLTHWPGSALQHCAEEFLAELWLELGCADQARAELARTPIEQVCGVRRAFRLDLLARLGPAGEAREQAWQRALAAAEDEVTPGPTRLRVRLNASLDLPADQARSQCELALAEARRGEYPPGELLAHLRLADLAARTGDWAQAEQAIAAALHWHEAGIRHVFVSLAELHGQAWRVRRQLPPPAQGQAEAARVAGLAAIDQALQGGQLPPECLPHYVAGHPWRRRLVSSQALGLSATQEQGPHARL